MEVGLDSFQRRPLNSDEEDDNAIDFDDEPDGDLYEYEEGVPEEESRKNNRYDRHDNYDYELPEDFEGSSDDSIDANIQLALSVVRKLQEKVETRACIVFPDKPENRRASQLFKAAFDSVRVRENMSSPRNTFWRLLKENLDIIKQASSLPACGRISMSSMLLCQSLCFKKDGPCCPLLMETILCFLMH